MARRVDRPGRTRYSADPGGGKSPQPSYAVTRIRLHAEAPISLLERTRPGTILGAGAILALLPLIGIAWATGIADLALAALAAAIAGGTGWAWREAKRLAELPLEVAPVALVGWLDGGTVYRFRARLGRGRSLRDPTAEVRFVPEGGPPIDLVVEWPARSLCGPVTLLVRDPGDRVRPPGRFVVALTVRSAGRTWAATTEVPADAVRRGRFGGVGVADGRVVFDDRWATVVEEAP